MKKFVIIDGNSLLHRSWHALPPLTTRKGEVVNALYGFIMVFLKMLRELKPDYLAVAWDTKKPTFRHKEFKEYKAQRIKQPEELYHQIKRVKEFLEILNVPNYEKDGYEADDIIATLVELNSKENLQLIILSGDLDALQLVGPKVKVYSFKKGLTEKIIYDENKVKERFGILPKQLVDYKALKGDPSDNISGVPGIGEKSAIELIKRFGSLENLYKSLESNKTTKIKERIKNLLKKYKKEAFVSQELVKMKKNVPIKFSLNDCKLKPWDKTKVISFFKEFDFSSLIDKIPSFWGGKGKEEISGKKTKTEFKDYKLIDEEKDFLDFFQEFKKQTEISLDTETSGLNPFEAELLGLSFSWEEGRAFYLPYRSEWLKKLKPFLEDKSVKKIGHNLKYDAEVLANYNINLDGLYFDTMLAAYLLNPGARVYDLDRLVFHYLGHQMQPIEELIGPKGKKQISLKEVSLKDVAEYSCEDADYTLRLQKKLSPLLDKEGLKNLFYKVEMPLIIVLKEMEGNGIKVNVSYLKELSAYVLTLLKSLEEKIYKLVGRKFNISSPLQLRKVLFEDLKISSQGIKKSKTGFSTAASELMKLVDKHPIIGLIFEYRELSKLKNTYLDTIPQLVDKRTNRLHTNFNQTITATGRLSSSNPNLQNIPVRTDLGKKIRQAFVAEKGFKLLSADYSQIELRIIAHLANDEKMIQSFKNGEDIHRQTAAEINNCSLEEVNYQMRRAAKTINFGLIYGMSIFGLAQSAGISREKARQFIERYFSLHPEIKRYLEEKKKEAREKGYVQTLFGRRRFLPEINSQIPQLRNEAERMAINMPIQGTAADLMKMAMIEVRNFISKVNNSSKEEIVKMILQVHDELLFEIKRDFVKEIGLEIKKIMENVIKLKVPIVVDLRAGDNWGKMEEINNK